MPITTITQEIAKITYIYHADGAIEPYLNLYPGISLDEYTHVAKLSVLALSEDSDFDIAAGDTVTFSVSRDNELLATVVNKSKSDNKRINLKLDTCPVCGSKLVHFTDGDLGCCINRSCNAQLYNNLITFLAALGISLTGVNSHIVSSLVCRGKLASLADVFLLNYTDIVDGCITVQEARIFIQYLHSIRGHISIDQLLTSLSIPELDRDTVEAIRDLFIINKFTLLDVNKLFDEKFRLEYKGIDWIAWERFISLEANRNLILRLSTILYI